MGPPGRSTGTSSQPFGFTGEPRDATGFTYLRARYYDPELGRFLSRDTWPGIQAQPITLNRYTYANNNPTTLTDPSGHFVDAIVDVLSLAYDAWSLATGPEKDRAINLAALGADAASLAIPGFTGGGWFVRGASHADEVADGLRWADEAATAACSFTAETLVATPDGPVEISTINVGDIVLAWDETSGEVVERPVTAVLPHPNDEIAKVTIDGVVITTTPDHPFYTLDRGWVEAGDLWAGSRVKTTSGFALIEGVRAASYTGTLWDLTVAGAHTFFVGSPETLVHNCAFGSAPLKPLHSSLDDSTLEYLRRQSTEEIIDSLKPGSLEPLIVKADGTIMQGNHRIQVLTERGVDVNALPRTMYP